MLWEAPGVCAFEECEGEEGVEWVGNEAIGETRAADP